MTDRCGAEATRGAASSRATVALQETDHANLVRVRRVLTLGCVLAAVASGGCFDGGARSLSVSVDPGSFTGLEQGVFEIYAAGCDALDGATRVHEASIDTTGGAASPELEPGRYCFVVHAWNADCSTFARGATEVELPRKNDSAVTVALETDCTVDGAGCERECTPGGIRPPPRLRWPHNGMMTGTPRKNELSPSLEFRETLVLEPQFETVDWADRYELVVTCVDSADVCEASGDIVDADEAGEPMRQLATPPLLAGDAVVDQRPIGARVQWHVRACDEAGFCRDSNERLLDVGRSVRDYDGDGVDAFVVGDPAGEAIFEVVHDFEEQPNPCIAVTVAVGTAEAIETTRHDVPEPCGTESRFGGSTAPAGDVDADGFPDRVVGAPGCNTAFVLFGGPTGLDDGYTRLAPTDGSAPVAFGAAVGGAGDVDGDGFADVVVSDPDSDEVWVYYGDAGRELGEQLAVHEAIEPTSEVQLGASVSLAGDVNADGYAEILLGAPGTDAPAQMDSTCGAETCTDTGAIHLCAGGPERMLEACQRILPQGTHRKDNFRMGVRARLARDFDGDRFSDAVSGGSPLAKVFIRRGAQSSGMPQLLDPDEVSPEGAVFTATPVHAVGDVDGDGASDLVVGLPQSTMPENNVQWFLGKNSMDVVDDGSGPFTPMSVEGDEARYGAAVDVADFDGDRRLEIAAGAPDAPGGGLVVVHCLPGETGGPGEFAVIDPPTGVTGWGEHL